MICANFDHFCPGADAAQMEMNVHTAQTAAQALAENTMELIKKDFTPHGSFNLQQPPRLRDLEALLCVAATKSVLSLAGPDGRKIIKIGENSSFLSAVMGCANRVLTDVMVEDAK